MSIQEELQGLMNAMAKADRAGDAAGCRGAIEALHQEWTQGGENKQLNVLDARPLGGPGLVPYRLL